MSTLATEKLINEFNQLQEQSQEEVFVFTEFLKMKEKKITI